MLIAMLREMFQHRDWHSGPNAPCDMFGVYKDRCGQQIDAACQDRVPA
jgi:hypothetical protein